MFASSRERPELVWQRFHVDGEGFESGVREGLFAARAVTGAERAVALFRELLVQLEPSVSVALLDVRSGREWMGRAVPREFVAEAADRARDVLSRHAGVEIAVFDAESQVTLGRHLEVFVHARSERWYFLLRGCGLPARRELRPRSWRLAPDEFGQAPALEPVLSQIVSRCQLEAVAP